MKSCALLTLIYTKKIEVMEHKTPLNKVQQGILPEKNMIISYVNQVEIPFMMEINTQLIVRENIFRKLSNYLFLRIREKLKRLSKSLVYR